VKTKESTETLTLRVPTSVKLQIEMAAHKDGRTINSWVNKILKEYFDDEKEKG
jgi:predicted HicB family RNase H-like nuclease